MELESQSQFWPWGSSSGVGSANQPVAAIGEGILWGAELELGGAGTLMVPLSAPGAARMTLGRAPQQLIAWPENALSGALCCLRGAQGSWQSGKLMGSELAAPGDVPLELWLELWVPVPVPVNEWRRWSGAASSPGLSMTLRHPVGCPAQWVPWHGPWHGGAGLEAGRQ